HITVAIGMKEDLTRDSVPRQVHQHALVDAAVVEETVWAPLISPDRVSVPRISRKDGRRPLVVPRPLVRIPRRSAGGAVVHEIEHGVVGDPTPYGSTADLPTVRGPARDSEILTAVGCVEGMKPGSEQDVAV